MNLIVGATGLLGGEICRVLARQGKTVRAMVRPTSSPEKVAHLRQLGADVVTGDLKEPSSLAAACRGVTAVGGLQWECRFQPAGQPEREHHQARPHRRRATARPIPAMMAGMGLITAGRATGTRSPMDGATGGIGSQEVIREKCEQGRGRVGATVATSRRRCGCGTRLPSGAPGRLSTWR